MKLTDEQQRFFRVARQYGDKIPMTTISGLFHGKTIRALKEFKLIEDAFMGGWYLLTELGKQVSNEVSRKSGD